MRASKKVPGETLSQGALDRPLESETTPSLSGWSGTLHHVSQPGSPSSHES